MSDKKLIVVVAGMGDTLLSPNSQRRLKNAEQLEDSVEKALKHFQGAREFVGVVNLHYSTDTFKDTNVFRAVPKTRLVDMKLNTRSVVHVNNEITLQTLDGGKLSMRGTEFTFLFRPQEYEVVFLGVDLHGMFLEAVDTLLKQGYSVKLVKDALSTFPSSLKTIRDLQENNRDLFSFCPATSV